MARTSVSRSLLRLAGVTVVASQFASGLGSPARAHESEPRDPRPEPEVRRASLQTTSSFCTPIFGTGKSVGVPIRIEDHNGNAITNLGPYQFELTNGSTSQLVTSLISTAELQPLAVGQQITSFPSVFFPTWGKRYAAYGAGSVNGPALDFTNPGYFFLGCTPDGTNANVKFGSNITLQMKLQGTVVASVSLSGRSPSFIDEDALAAAPLTSAIKPTGSSHTDFAGLYGTMVSNTGVRFRPTFAATAIMEMSNNFTQSTFYCWQDLVSTSGSTWNWTSNGQNFLNELTSPNASTWPILDARTKGTAGPVHPTTSVNPCNMSGSTVEDDFFVNHFVAQLLLFDGPRGNISPSARGSIDAFLPASVLTLAAPATTTTTTVAATTTTVAGAAGQPGAGSTTSTSISTVAASTGRSATPQTRETLPATGGGLPLLSTLTGVLTLAFVARVSRRRFVN